ncbi:MAG: type IV toxin-antitoxin system AbiEi family antitoxin domain-containing protein [Pseudobdellovibrionaceae bacterium]
MSAKGEKHLKLIDYIETLQSQGRYWFTKSEALKALAITTPAFHKATLRLIQKTKLMRIRNGFYVIVPAEYRKTKSLPATFYIDALMKFMKQPYYVGALSAAALHGAAHQSPQELQVVTSKPIPMIESGATRIRFITKKDVRTTPVQQLQTPTGFMEVSTPEATIFDLLRYVRLAGHLDNVTTAIVELLETIHPTKLVQVAKLEKEFSYVQRLGYLVDRFSPNKVISMELHRLLEKKRPGFIFLRPDQRKGITERNEKWNVFVNTEVEPDL